MVPRYGPAFCTMKNGSSCTTHTDFIAVAADGTWDAGDPFDAWWGDDSWRTANEDLDLVPGKTAGYVAYVKKPKLV